MLRPAPQMVGLWDQIKAKLADDPTLQDLLYGAGHVYLEGEDYSRPERDEGVPWGRLVVVPALSLWPQADAPGPFQPVAFLIRAEVNRFNASGYSFQRALEGLQLQAKALLDNWVPEPIPNVVTRVSFPIFLQRIMEPRPLWDDVRKLHFTSTEYRMEVFGG